MKYILILFFALTTIISWAQPGSVNVGAIRSKVTDSTTVVAPTGYGVMYFNSQSSKWRCFDGVVWTDCGASTGTTYTFNSPLSESSGVVSLNDVPLSNIVQGTSKSVLGVSGGSTADYANIQALSDDQVLRSFSGSLGFGNILPTSITVPAETILGNSTGVAGEADQLTIGSGLDFSGGSLVVDQAAFIEDAINDSETTKAPTENAVYDALQLKVDKSANLTDLASGATALKNIGGLERAAVANTQSGNYTLAATDFTSSTIVYLTGSGQTITVPNNSTIPITAGVYVYFWRTGANAALFSSAGGVTITSTSGANLDPGQYQLCALIKEPGTTNNWLLFNGGTPLGSSNQVLGVNNAGTIQEYKTISNGLTSATGTIKLGGALTADTNLSGAFSLGLNATPSAKLHVVGLGTTTGELLRLTDNTPTTRLSILDNGGVTHVATLSGTGTTGISSTINTSSTANSQTLAGFDFVVTPTYGANTGVVLNTFRVRATTAAADYYKIAQASSGTASTQTWDASTIYDFKNSSSTSTIRNSAAALRLSGGTASTTRMLQLGTTVASSTNNNAAINFTGNTHDLGSAVTRTLTEILNDASITSVNGSTITYSIFDNSPSFAIGTSTATLTGYNYNPTLTSGTFTHYANRWQSGLSAFGSAVPLSTVDNQGSQGHAITSTSTDITLDVTHYTIKVDASGANRTITLPAAASNSRRVYTIKKTDSSGNTVTVDGNASETIDGATTYVMSAQWKYVTIQCDGSNWMITSNN